MDYSCVVRLRTMVDFQNHPEAALRCRRVMPAGCLLGDGMASIVAEYTTLRRSLTLTCIRGFG